MREKNTKCVRVDRPEFQGLTKDSLKKLQSLYDDDYTLSEYSLLEVLERKLRPKQELHFSKCKREKEFEMERI